MAETLYQNRKEHIQKTAQSLFRQKGYSATSMRNLASEVGIEPASIYSHIKGKEEILHSICFGMAETFFAKQNHIAQENISAKEKLEKAIVAHIEIITSNIDAAAVFFHDWRHLSEPALKEFKKLRHDYENIFRNIINKGIEERVFRTVDVNFTVLTIFSAMNWTYDWYKPESGMKAEEIGKQLSNILLNGLNR
ncbi:MAG: TetR/AcrR family transcriptional regulator [Bacteroidia bacterium]